MGVRVSLRAPVRKFEMPREKAPCEGCFFFGSIPLWSGAFTRGPSSEKSPRKGCAARPIARPSSRRQRARMRFRSLAFPLVPCVLACAPGADAPLGDDDDAPPEEVAPSGPCDVLP